MLLRSEQSMTLNALCDAILNCNKKIGFIAIINANGILLESKNHHGVTGCLPRKRKEAFFMEYALRQRMRSEFNNDFGSVRYTCAEREKEVLFTFPLHDLLVLVTCSPGIMHADISREIISIIDECKAKLNLKTNIEKRIQIHEEALS